MIRKKRFIYQLRVDGEPFYVGLGTYPSRPYEHIEIARDRSHWRYNPEQDEMYDFILERVDRVEVFIVARDLDYEVAVEMEARMTKELGTRYDGEGNLFNIKYGSKFPEGFRSGENNSFYGKTHSVESLDKLRSPRSVRWSLSEETKRKMSKNHRGPTKLLVVSLKDGTEEVFDTIKSAAVELQRRHPDKPFSVSYVTSMSRSPVEMSGLYYIERI